MRPSNTSTATAYISDTIKLSKPSQNLFSDFTAVSDGSDWNASDDVSLSDASWSATLVWTSSTNEGENPVTGETTTTQRRRLKRDFELPMRDDYNTFVSGLLAEKRSGAVSSC